MEFASPTYTLCMKIRSLKGLYKLPKSLLKVLFSYITWVYFNSFLAIIIVRLFLFQCRKNNFKSPLSQGINESANFRFLQRLSVILASAETVRDLLLPAETTVHEKMASCRDSPCDSVSCRDSRQEAESHEQSLQEAIYQAQQSRQEARDRGQSRRKPNMTDSLCKERKLADSFIPCDCSLLVVITSKHKSLRNPV